jgi:hypothetical protein
MRFLPAAVERAGAGRAARQKARTGKVARVAAGGVPDQGPVFEKPQGFRP